jgi:carbonic anhydrase/acetyltransferase-like protein (isoleucine patch superfamily)
MIRSFQGHVPSIAADVYIDPSAQIIGQVSLGALSSVWCNAVLRGDVHTITIGERTNIQDCAVLHGMRGLHPVVIGSGCTIGHNATVHGCTLEDDVLIGMGAIVLNGCLIGTGSLIAAGAVVAERTIIPPGSLVAGVPGKVRRTLDAADLAMVRGYADNYVHYSAVYLAELKTTDLAIPAK